MIWPLRRKSKKRMARICIEGPINSETRKIVLKALKQIEEREFPALLLRIDSPGGTVGDSQEIHSALLRLREKGCHVVASFGNISASGGDASQNFRVSLGYKDSEAVNMGSSFESISGSVAYTRKFGKATISTSNLVTKGKQLGQLESTAYFGNPNLTKFFMPMTEAAFNPDN